MEQLPDDIKGPGEIMEELEGKDSPGAVPDSRLLAEVAFAEMEKDLRLQYFQAQVSKFRDDNAGRRGLSTSIFIVTLLWMFFVLHLVYECAASRAALPGTVLITLLTTTTANVFGFLCIVTNYLFNKEKST